MIISLEGIDGSGKTIMARSLQDYIRGAHDIRSIVTSEFNYSIDALEEKAKLAKCQSPSEEYQIVMNLRRTHNKEVVEPALKDGLVVIFDRYIHSTMAYQGINGSMLQEYLEDHVTSNILLPDLTFILQIDPELASKRLIARQGLERMDLRGLDYFKGVSAGFDSAVLFLRGRTHHVKIAANNAESEIKRRIANAFTRYHESNKP